MNQRVKTLCWKCNQPLHLTLEKKNFDPAKNRARKIVRCRYCRESCEVVIDGAMIRADLQSQESVKKTVRLDELEQGALFYKVFASYRPDHVPTGEGAA